VPLDKNVRTGAPQHSSARVNATTGTGGIACQSRTVSGVRPRRVQ
jgi:hypothetical protein